MTEFSLSRLWPKTLNFWNARLTSPCYRAAVLTLLILPFGIQYSQPSLCRRNFTPTNVKKPRTLGEFHCLYVYPPKRSVPKIWNQLSCENRGWRLGKCFFFFIAVHITVLFFVTHPNRHSAMVSKRWEPNTHLCTRVIRPSIFHGALVWWSKVMEKILKLN